MIRRAAGLLLTAALLSGREGHAQGREELAARGLDPVENSAGIAVSADSLGVPGFTGVTLPPGHWAVEAVERASALLLLPSWVPAQRALPLELVESGLRRAIANAEATHPTLLLLAKGWYARLQAEFPGLADSGGGDGLRLLERRAGIAFSATEGAAAPGLGEFEPERTGALPLPDLRTPLVNARLAAAWSNSLSLAGETEADRNGAETLRLELAAGLGAWRASIGRGEVGYGFGTGGGVALTGAATIDAVQLGTRQAVELPGFVKPLGHAALHTFVGRLDEERHPDDPWFWGASLRIQPNRRFTLGVSRAAIFGGDEAVTTERVLSMLIGRVVGLGFENQVVSASGRLTLPTERVVPVVLHLEWGAEDAAGSWWAVPGIVGGVSIPAVPTLRELSLTAEYAHFGSSCCGNPPWYRHWSFPGAWAAGDRTLGYPLGGSGSQFMVSATVDLPAGRVEGQVFRRDRGAENLFAPERLGVSRGVVSSLELTPFRGWQVRLDAAHETGGSWSDSRIRFGIERF